MSNYAHTSFGAMCRWVAAERGWNAVTDKDKIIKETNRVRQWLYSAYTRLKLAVDVEECIQVEQFCDNCNDCQTTYSGISLPDEFISAAGIWINGAMVQANSRWREFQEGISRQISGNRLEATYLGSSAATERDICPCGACAFIGFQADRKEDIGKIVTIQYRDVNKQPHTDQIILRLGEYVQTATEVQSIDTPGGITLPHDLCGGVIVAQMDTLRILSEYKPWQHKPGFRRLSLPGACKGRSVLVRGNRRYHELYWEHETAELANELAVIEVVRYLRLIASVNPEGGHHQLAKIHEAEAMKYISGDQNRETGDGTVNQIKPNSGGRKRPRLKSLG